MKDNQGAVVVSALTVMGILAMLAAVLIVTRFLGLWPGWMFRLELILIHWLRWGLR